MMLIPITKVRFARDAKNALVAHLSSRFFSRERKVVTTKKMATTVLTKNTDYTPKT
jgi:hypothetical protein